MREHGRIVVGDVNALGLAERWMAKSVLDAPWSLFREMLRYKAFRYGASFAVINDPKGIADLGIRQWACSGSPKFAAHAYDYIMVRSSKDRENPI